MYVGKYIGNRVKASTTVCSLLNIPDLQNEFHSVTTDTDYEMKPARIGVSSTVQVGEGVEGLVLAICGTAGLLLVEVTNCSTTTHKQKTSSISSSVFWASTLCECFQVGK